MPYRVRGTLSDAARLIILKESDWSIDYSGYVTAGTYSVDVDDDSTRLAFARENDAGWTIGWGNITPEEYIVGNFLDLGTGDHLLINSTDGLLIS